jgi:hypothetical protein
VSELVIVATDLYLASGSESAVPPRFSVPGLERVVRFGRIETLTRGWRYELASRLGRSDLAASPPAAVAAASVERPQAPADAFAWLADPLHLAASLTSVHLMPRGLLRLDAATQEELRRAFNDAFAETGYQLTPTRAGRFIASGPPPVGEVETTDPARCLGASLEGALPCGRGSAPLRRVGAEIEMWLHEHRLNAHRAATGRAPISTLWLWGGGMPLAREMARSSADNASPPPAFFSDDAYVEGLAHLLGAPCAPPPRTRTPMSAMGERHSVVTLELFTRGELDRVDVATPLLALETFDREWLVPVLDEVARGSLTRCTLIANDRCVSFTKRDRWRLWRRPRAALAALTDGTAAGAASAP